jgi:carboxymethylenebutenolidase
MIIGRRCFLFTALAAIPVTALDLRRTVMAETAIETITLKTPSGRTVSAALAAPAATPAPAVLLVHGASGLIDVDKSFALDFARDGFLALAIDLFEGHTANNDTDRSALVQEASRHPERISETLAAWIEWIRTDKRANGKIGIVGWSFGAGWALKASIVTPVDATVLYVGFDYFTTEELAHLKGPVLAQLGERDMGTNRPSFDVFAGRMKEAGRSLQVYWYPGDHYFPFPNRPTYDKDLADKAWARTVDFLHSQLG